MRASEFEVTRADVAAGLTVLTPVEELDLASVPRLEAAVEDALRSGSSRLVLDLGQLTFVDSSGLRFFLLLCRRARSEGWQLTLTRPSDPVRTLLEITDAASNLPLVEKWELS
jgi:anti-sigma B factor antagonist